MSRFGAPEKNMVLTVEQTYKHALSNGYLQQLQAYGVGKGLSQSEAEHLMLENMGTLLYEQEGETFQRIQNLVATTRAKKGSVSTGDINVKENISPASKEAPPNTNTTNNEGAQS